MIDKSNKNSTQVFFFYITNQFSSYVVTAHINVYTNKVRFDGMASLTMIKVILTTTLLALIQLTSKFSLSRRVLHHDSSPCDHPTVEPYCLCAECLSVTFPWLIMKLTT